MYTYVYVWWVYWKVPGFTKNNFIFESRNLYAIHWVVYHSEYAAKKRIENDICQDGKEDFMKLLFSSR